MRLKMCIIGLLLLSSSASFAGDSSYNRVHFSFTLSGHLLFGAGFEYGFNDQHSIQVTGFPLMWPGKGFPFAFSAGYGYHFNTQPWRAKLGVDFALLVSPPDPEKRRTMPMLMFTPGIEYLQKNNHSVSTQFWLAHFLKETNKKIFLAPIGWEFRYSRDL